MRLLNVKTMQLEEFGNCYIAPKYATLSHTWGPAEEEITFQDLDNALKKKIDFTSLDVADAWRRAVKKPSLRDIFANHPTKKVGWAKIEGACRKIRDNVFRLEAQYIWIDTCCIDKSSSSELQEAINSMFSWYQHSQICLIYLADVRVEHNPAKKDSTFRNARWFTRGWTLQELIAPQVRCFLDRNWDQIGHISVKPHAPGNLTDLVSEITGIHSSYLFELSRASVAVRMSWAACRRTSREEDAAYCLLGIFGIHMPMLYGEGGPRAFIRLQEEIMKVTDDCSLLSWGLDHQRLTRWSSSRAHFNAPFSSASFLANHPKYFNYCKFISPLGLRGFHPPSFSIAQRGLMMQLPVIVDKINEHIAYGILACGYQQYLVAIPLISTKAVRIKSNVTFNRDPENWESDLIQHEYVRPDYFKPYIVSSEFLNGAKEERIVIRRTSWAWFNPEFVNLPIQVDCDFFRVLTVYPPQSTTDERYCVCLGSFSTGQSDSWAQKILVDYEIRNMDGEEVPADCMVHCESGRVIIFVEDKACRLLITLEYRAIYLNVSSSGRGSEQQYWIHFLDTPPCQIFKFSQYTYFYLESLQALASSWDFSSWGEEKLVASKESTRNKSGAKVFKYSSKNSDDVVAQISLSKDSSTGASKIRIYNGET